VVEFRAELETSGGNAAGFEVPEPVVDQLGGGGHPKVVVRVNGYEFRTSIARMGSRFMLGVSKERRAAAGVAPGETLDVQVELDTAPRESEVPDDLAAALSADAQAMAFFDSLSYSKQQWHILQVSGAKQAETRARRVTASVAMLREGRAR
jgi:Bacteriocin-protection, YdeI or OmpD-Associated/Domain of unknown function (DUF1905)